MRRRLLGWRAPPPALKIGGGIVAGTPKHSGFSTKTMPAEESKKSGSQEPYQPPDGPDPYNYTSGRWLHRDQLQVAARFIQFDFTALCQKVLSLYPGDGRILKYEKKEGGFNRVFIFYMANKCIVARLSFHGAGPERLTTHSEVATMAYIRKHTDIPVPEVIEWSDNKANSIGAEYIIMEQAPGVQLHGRWPDMNTHQHMICVKNLARLIKSMANLPFPAYGSIYFANASIDPKLKVPLGDFCIGPHCGRDYWDCTAGEKRYYLQKKPNRGPWLDLAQYSSALLDAGVSRIPSPDVAAPKSELPYRGSVKEHLRLLKIRESVIEELINTPVIQNLATPVLLHADLHKRNIFVSEDDPTIITSVIDWQATSIEPALALAYETPDLIPIRPPPASILSDEAETSLEDAEDPETAKARKQEEKDIWICRQTFEVVMKASVPRLFAARAADENFLRLFRYSSSSWRNSAAALRQELIELSQRWTELKPPGVCPYQPTSNELAEHATQWEDFEDRQKLKQFLVENLQSDSEGWVPTEAWEPSKVVHKEAFDAYMQGAIDGNIDPNMTVERAKELWPFDIEKEATV